MNPELEQLLQIWEQAIAEWKSDKSSIRIYDIAENAMSHGSYFQDTYRQDDLLEEIHHNFGLLEVPGPDDDPNNSRLWEEQAVLVAKARAEQSKT